MALGTGGKQVGRAYVKLDVDDRGLTKGLKNAEQSTHRFGGVMKGALVAGAAAGAAGLYAAAKATKVFWQEMEESQKVAAQTNAVIKSTGGVANVSAKQVSDLANTILRKSGIDDEATKSGENMLLTFKNIHNEVGKGNDIFNQTTSVLADMETAMSHGNVTSEGMSKSAIRLGKALNDPIKGITALSRVGVTFTDGQKETIKRLVETGRTMDAQKIILHELNSEFGGSAEAMGKTLPGQINILKESFKNWGADLLSNVIPVFTSFLGYLNQIGAAKGITAKIRVAWEGVQDFAVNIGRTIGDAIQNAGGWRQVGTRVAEAISNAISFTADQAQKLVQSLLGAVNQNRATLADVGAGIAVAMASKLTDPGFWAHHWRELVAISLALFGGSLVRGVGAIAGRFSTRFGATLARLLPDVVVKAWGFASTRLLKQVGETGGRLTRRLQQVFSVAAVSAAIRAMVNFVHERLNDLVGFFTTWSKKAGLAIIEPFSHLPGAAGGWARKLKQTWQTELANIKIDKFNSETERQWNALTPKAREAAKKAGQAWSSAFGDEYKKIGAIPPPFAKLTPSKSSTDHVHNFAGAMKSVGERAKDAKGPIQNAGTASDNAAGKHQRAASALRAQASGAKSLATNAGRIPKEVHEKADAVISFSVAKAGVRRQGGGFIPMLPGTTRGKDGVLSYLAPGEAVLNEKQQAVLGGPRALAQMFGFQLPSGMADGGFVGATPKFNKVLRGGVLDLVMNPKNWPQRPALSRMMAEAWRINNAHMPYLWGGGHSTPPGPGPYDCSGAVSEVLDAGGLLPGHSALDSSAFMRYGAAGAGKSVTIYARGAGRTGHAFMSLNGAMFGTGAPWGGAGWHAHSTAGFVQRHPPGYAGGGIQAKRPHRDDLLAWLAPGEVVLTPDEQQKLGGPAHLIRTLGLQDAENAYGGMLPGLAGGGVYSAKQIANLASSHGFPRDHLQMAVAIALAESGGVVGQVTHEPNHTTSYGLWQINSVHGLPANRLRTADYNATQAARLSNHGSNWQPWSTYKNGRYRHYMAEAARAIKAVKKSRPTVSGTVRGGRTAPTPPRTTGTRSGPAAPFSRDREGVETVGSDQGYPDDPLTGDAWGQLPAKMEEAIFDASLTPSLADDNAALTTARYWLTSQLARAGTIRTDENTRSVIRLAIKNKIKDINDQIDALTSDTGGGGDGGGGGDTGGTGDGGDTGGAGDFGGGGGDTGGAGDTTAPPGPTQAEINAQIAAAMSMRSRFFSEFAPNIFSASSTGLQLGATPLSGPLPMPAAKGALVQNITFTTPPENKFAWLKTTKFAADAVLG